MVRVRLIAAAAGVVAGLAIATFALWRMSGLDGVFLLVGGLLAVGSAILVDVTPPRTRR